MSWGRVFERLGDQLPRGPDVNGQVGYEVWIQRQLGWCFPELPHGS